MTEQLLNGGGPWAEFQRRLNKGLFCIQRGFDGGHFFYPRVNVPTLGGDAWQWVEASGLGCVYSVSRIPRRAERGGDYYVAIVELQEGPRLMTQLRLASRAEPKIGDAVQAVVENANSDSSKDVEALLVFKHEESLNAG